MRASDYESAGRVFESSRARSLILFKINRLSVSDLFCLLTIISAIYGDHVAEASRDGEKGVRL